MVDHAGDDDNDGRTTDDGGGGFGRFFSLDLSLSLFYPLLCFHMQCCPGCWIFVKPSRGMKKITQ